ncbi:MAG: glycerophosphodiester phosphodiesterase family protein [Acidobacteriota bacterium]
MSASSPTSIAAFLMLERPRIIAHRGVSGDAPENTLVAFEKAIQMRADMIELDVTFTRDGQVVCLHDETLDRTTSGSGDPRTQTLEELRELDAGSWFDAQYAGERMPTLDEALRLMKDEILVNIEIKSEAVDEGEEPGIVEAIAALVKRLDMVDQVVISSFSRRGLERSRRVAPEIARAVLYTDDQYPDLAPGAALLALEAVAVNVHHRQATLSTVKDVHGAGGIVMVYTVNDPALAETLFVNGVDAIFSDQPGQMIALFTRGKT